MNSKKQLAFKEYNKLSDEEKRKRYVELTDNDKLRVRTSDYIHPITVGHMKVTEKHRLEVIKERAKLNKYLDNYNSNEKQSKK